MEKRVLIEFSNVSKSFNNNRVLNDINLKIFESEVFGLLGPSGSGKTTLMNLLLGLYKPDSGKIYFKGKEISNKEIRKIVGLTTQENSFYNKLTVHENMRYYANLYDVSTDIDTRIKTILDSVKLGKAKNVRAERLSGGMKRRLDFAISILHEPELLIMDEPTTGLDPLLVIDFWKLIREFNSRGKTILVISHIFPEIKENCHNVCILISGKVSKIVKITKNTDLLHEFSVAAGEKVD